MVEAASREVREETGLILTPRDLGEPVADNAGEWSLRGSRYYTVHTYFFARVPTTDFSMTEDDGLGHRWWTVAQLDVTEERTFPRGALIPNDLHGEAHGAPGDAELLLEGARRGAFGRMLGGDQEEGGDSCVLIAPIPGVADAFALRDAKNPDAGTLRFAGDELRAAGLTTL